MRNFVISIVLAFLLGLAVGLWTMYAIDSAILSHWEGLYHDLYLLCIPVSPA